MAAAFAAIGNGGMLYRPWLVKRVLSPSGSTLRESLPSLRRRIDLPAGVLSTVREGLRRVVNEPGGTGSVVRSSRVEIAGKTGTAQVRQFSDMSRVDCASLPYEQRHHAWFVGYAPARDPQVAVAVITEHACHGAASPVARDVFQAYFAAQAEPDTPVDR
jgi:penicillin-binding protein 2